MRWIGDFRRATMVCLGALVFRAAPSFAVTVELAHHDAPRRQQWELLSVSVNPPAGGGTVAVQDARGGLVVSRPISSGETDAAGGQVRVTIPLPYLAEADLPPAVWPILVSITSAAGTQREKVEVPRVENVAVATGGRASFRVVVPIESRERGVSVPPQLSPLPVVLTFMREDEILSGPPLLFASCDAILLSPQLAAKLPEDRAAALIDSGVQLLTSDDSARPVAENSPLVRLNWKRIPADAFAGWIAPAAPLPRPTVLEPHLLQARPLRFRATPDRRTIGIILLIPVGSLVAVILARGLFRRAAVTLLAVAAASTGLSAVAILCIYGASPPDVREVSWSTRTPADLSRPAAAENSDGSFAIQESFTAESPLFGHRLHAVAGQSALLFAVAGSPREYYSFKDAVLSLDVPSNNGLERGSSLEITLPPRGFVVYVSRSAVPADPLGSDAMASSRGAWIEGGYVWKSAPAASGDGNKVILTQWAAEHRQLEASLLAWYELRFAADHRYFIELSPLGEAEARQLNLIDLGLVKAPASEP